MTAPLRFLVVDDDASSVDGMKRLLELDGHEVAPFTTGAAAVDAIARGTFDAVVTDLEMPGVNGHAVISAARRHLPNACVVVVSGRGDRRALADAGACAVLDKPVHYDSVTGTVTGCRAAGGSGRHGVCLRKR